MKSINIRGVTLGDGIPKIIVPIVGKTRAEILNKAAEIVNLPAQLVEWRADFYDALTDVSALLETARRLRAAIGELPLLFTIRLKRENGGVDLDAAAYTALNLALANSGCADLIDMEFSADEATIRANLDGIHAAGCRVVGSRHDFEGTPDKDTMLAWLREAQALGADIPKIAVMPQSSADVLALLTASVEMYEQYADRPILAISMGPRGVLSRVACEMCGSCMTFGAVGQTSAPGQIQVIELKNLLRFMHTVSSSRDTRDAKEGTRL